MAPLFKQIKQYTAASQAYVKALKFYETAIDSNPQFLSDYITILINYGNLFRENKNYHEAKTLYTIVLDRFDKKVIEDGSEYKSKFAKCHNNIAITYEMEGLYSQAEQHYLQALEARRILARHNSKMYNSDLADTLNDLGVFYRKTNKLTLSESSYLEALSIRENLARLDPLTYQVQVGATANNLSIFYFLANPNKEKSIFYAKKAIENCYNFIELNIKAKEHFLSGCAVMIKWNEHPENFISTIKN